MKIVLGIEYVGHSYYGWQRQKICPTVQQTLELSLSQIANETINVVCAGRTDTGVHAIQQVVHFETNASRKSHGWVLGTNTKLPTDIAVTWAKNIDDDFHARFSAERRTYQYLILNRSARPAILNGLATWVPYQLNLETMQLAAKFFIGVKDFTSYRAIACQAASPIRTVYDLTIEKWSDFFLVTICANAFLHHMVRNIVGVLIEIGRGKKNVVWAQEVLLARSRLVGGMTAPADGLYLTHIQYPKHFGIPYPEALVHKWGLIK